jgi:hypothetical protein
MASSTAPSTSARQPALAKSDPLRRASSRALKRRMRRRHDEVDGHVDEVRKI